METTNITRRRGKSQASLDLVAAAYEILKEIQPVSVRAVCYKLFTKNLIRDMGERETNKVSKQLRDARLAGIIPYEWILDDTRKPERAAVWNNPAERIEMMKNYRRDPWQDQPEHIEVWSEKGTVRSLLSEVLDKYAVTFRVFRGYTSLTVINDVKNESQQESRANWTRILYVGDYDPSGMHMSEVDLPRRLEEQGALVLIQRVAVNAYDILADPGMPSFPASDKAKDKRYKWFVENHGDRYWELDAMDPSKLRTRVEEAIREYIDFDAWEKSAVTEAAEKVEMEAFLETWPGNRGPA
jgi:hypothetical protein